MTCLIYCRRRRGRMRELMLAREKPNERVRECFGIVERVLIFLLSLSEDANRTF